MDDGLRVTDRLVVPAAELRERFSRSSGPGGQGVNTTDSRVELSFDVAGSPSLPEPLRARALDRLAGRLVDGVLTIAASEHRAQLANREAARERMAALLREAVALALRRPCRALRRPCRAGAVRAAPARGGTWEAVERDAGVCWNGSGSNRAVTDRVRRHVTGVPPPCPESPSTPPSSPPWRPCR
ncbi:alternative ribosome rescue aminoacyl-tRNA hydrolase ArfB [Micromonospora sp. Rc5]|uniref:alternative ribosome rescue aminoacyl-tRNA hydrolase ArfB n=1 Tax=Micromonospora sp. Rc5 TaxID=1920666 RepID=UPI0026D0E168|nr:alternative ribosome rescue aminoacyl-tRNA hydrolase ArfB [Micromonospora sp. Rc5]